MLVPPLTSSSVNFKKFDSGNSSTVSTVSTNLRETILPCILLVLIVHFAIFVMGCLLVSCWFQARLKYAISRIDTVLI
jgi:hypothetical protein